MKRNAQSMFRYLLTVLLLVPALATAASQDAHTHGLATLTLALENGILEIHFESPAANLVGFEHEARSDDEKGAVARAETILKEPLGLFVFGGTNCQLKSAAVDVSGVVDEEQHTEDKSHDHHGHDEEHQDRGHSEISAEYRFSCKNAKQLDSVSVDLMAQFPGIEKIDAMWITESKQGAVTLTSKNKVIAL